MSDERRPPAQDAQAAEAQAQHARAAASAYAAAEGAESHAPSPDAVPGSERVAALEAELAELRDRWMRSEADAQNARNRHRKEMEDARNYAVQKFATDVAEAADNLRRGLDALPPAAADEPELLGKLRGGFEGVERAFIAMLERHGVQRVEATGQPFDPALHQAMSEQPAPSGVAPGTVLQAWTAGWTLHGRLLRPAMVVVAAAG